MLRLHSARTLLAALLSVAAAPLTLRTQLITPLGLTAGEWDFRLANCVYSGIDCTGRFRVYASPANAPSMSPGITPFNPFAPPSPGPPPANTVAGWDAFRMEIPTVPSTPSVHGGIASLNAESVASTFGTIGMPRSIERDGMDNGLLDFADEDYYRSDDYSELRVGFPPPNPLRPRLFQLDFKYDGTRIPIVDLPVIRWNTGVFTGYKFEYRTGLMYLKASNETQFSPALTDFTETQALQALRGDILNFLGMPEVTLGNAGIVAWEPFNLISRQTLLSVVRDIDSGAARYNGGFAMPLRDDLNTFLPPTHTVPEPGSMALVAVGAALVALTRRRMNWSGNA